MDETISMPGNDAKPTNPIESLVGFLHAIEGRAAMYVGKSDDVRSTEAFLTGIYVACHIFGYSYDPTVESDVLSRHGWERQSTGELDQMRAAGRSEEAIVRELIRLEAEKWGQRGLRPDRPENTENPYGSAAEPNTNG